MGDYTTVRPIYCAMLILLAIANKNQLLRYEKDRHLKDTKDISHASLGPSLCNHCEVIDH